MSKLNVILLIIAGLVIVGAVVILSIAPQKKALEKDMNDRIRLAKKDQWKFRT